MASSEVNSAKTLSFIRIYENECNKENMIMKFGNNGQLPIPRIGETLSLYMKENNFKDYVDYKVTEVIYDIHKDHPNIVVEIIVEKIKDKKSNKKKI